MLWSFNQTKSYRQWLFIQLNRLLKWCCILYHLCTFLKFYRCCYLFCFIFNCMQAKRMDVVAGETAGVEGQLLLLYPVLFTLQVCVNVSCELKAWQIQVVSNCSPPPRICCLTLLVLDILVTCFFSLMKFASDFWMLAQRWLINHYIYLPYSALMRLILDAMCCQVFEGYVGVLLLKTALHGLASEWQARIINYVMFAVDS
jgi:hypothetical protein